ncbi:N-acetyltransferase, partial [uncultured Campylobacter sp.]|uniref:GNAT family N-acetyltransferase n=1 Tax=uncultured Campylobacter sp. TaxID=218934 RepID=UPI002613C5A1
ISIKNFLKMSRKGQLEIAAIFEDFSALSAGGAADKNHAAESENLCAAKQDFCMVKQDCGEASQDRDAAGKNSDADNCGAAELASLSFENHGAADKKSNAMCEKSSLESKNPSAEASENSNAAAQNLSGEELVGFFVYRTEQTYKRAVLHHKQPPPRLNADKILRSKAHSGVEFACDTGSFGTASDEISNYVTSNEISDLSASDGVLGADQGLASDNIKRADGDLKQASAGEILCCGAATDKISNVSVHGEIPPSATKSEISSDAARGRISRYDENGISRRDESKISRYEKSEPSSGKQGEIFYVAYLGIDAKFRGLGIGSRLLALIATQNPRAQIVLDVEPPHEDAPNLAQRLRRIEFYGRHGF